MTMSAGLVVSDMRVGHRGADGGLLHQAIEQHSPGSRAASVEPEHELVEVVVHVPRIDGAVVGAKQPALQQRRDSVNTGQGGMRRPGRTQLNPRIVINAVARELFVDAPSRLFAPSQRVRCCRGRTAPGIDRGSVDSAHPNASEPLRFKHLHRDATGTRWSVLCALEERILRASPVLRRNARNDSSTSTVPVNNSRSGRTIARLKRCSIAQAVS